MATLHQGREVWSPHVPRRRGRPGNIGEHWQYSKALEAPGRSPDRTKPGLLRTLRRNRGLRGQSGERATSPSLSLLPAPQLGFEHSICFSQQECCGLTVLVLSGKGRENVETKGSYFPLCFPCKDSTCGIKIPGSLIFGKFPLGKLPGRFEEVSLWWFHRMVSSPPVHPPLSGHHSVTFWRTPSAGPSCPGLLLPSAIFTPTSREGTLLSSLILWPKDSLCPPTKSLTAQKLAAAEK